MVDAVLFLRHIFHTMLNSMQNYFANLSAKTLKHPINSLNLDHKVRLSATCGTLWSFSTL